MYAAVKAAGGDPELLRTGMGFTKEEIDKKVYPAVLEDYNRQVTKLPPDVLKQYMSAFYGMKNMEREDDVNFDKYQKLAGETQSRKVQAEYASGNYDQYPPEMPGFAPPEEQIIRRRDPVTSKITLDPGVRYQEVDHDPFAVAPAGTPMQLVPVEHDPFKQQAPPGPLTLTPVDQDPFAMQPAASLPAQPQMPVPAMPTTVTA